MTVTTICFSPGVSSSRFFACRSPCVLSGKQICYQVFNTRPFFSGASKPTFPEYDEFGVRAVGLWVGAT